MVQWSDSVEPFVVVSDQFLAGHPSRHLRVPHCEGHRRTEGEKALNLPAAAAKIGIAFPRPDGYRPDAKIRSSSVDSKTNADLPP
jgi:hypothetical protein